MPGRFQRGIWGNTARGEGAGRHPGCAGEAPGRLGLGLQAVAPRCCGTPRTFPGSTRNCIKEIPGCHHERILPGKNDLGKAPSRPSISGQEPAECSVQVSSSPCLSSSPTRTPPSCHPKGCCRGRRKLLSKDTLKTWKGSAAKASVKNLNLSPAFLSLTPLHLALNWECKETNPLLSLLNREDSMDSFWSPSWGWGH